MILKDYTSLVKGAGKGICFANEVSKEICLCQSWLWKERKKRREEGEREEGKKKGRMGGRDGGSGEENWPTDP